MDFSVKNSHQPCGHLPRLRWTSFEARVLGIDCIGQTKVEVPWHQSDGLDENQLSSMIFWSMQLQTCGESEMFGVLWTDLIKCSRIHFESHQCFFFCFRPEQGGGKHLAAMPYCFGSGAQCCLCRSCAESAVCFALVGDSNPEEILIRCPESNGLTLSWYKNYQYHEASTFAKYIWTTATLRRKSHFIYKLLFVVFPGNGVALQHSSHQQKLESPSQIDGEIDSRRSSPSLATWRSAAWREVAAKPSGKPRKKRHHWDL